VIKNPQKASAFHHCHYTKRNAAPANKKTDSLEKKHKKLQLEHVQSSNLGVLLRQCYADGVLLRQMHRIESDKASFEAVCLRREVFFRCRGGAGTADISQIDNKR